MDKVVYYYIITYWYIHEKKPKAQLINTKEQKLGPKATSYQYVELK